MDTTRADHIGCYGHPTVKTPNIDRLAAEGVMFTRCTTTVPLTSPSHSSIMAGTYPFVHGVRENMSFHLHEKNETLAEVLSQAGYVTGGVVGSMVLNRDWGLAQGFAQYNDMHDARQPTDPTTGQPSAARRGDEVVDLALGWLAAHADEKFFLFIHLYDPHHPYEPPLPYATLYADPYVGEIAFTDFQIGRLLDELTRRQLRDRTLIVLTSDHGEGLGDHDEDAHGCFLYETTLAVPLILNCPGRIPAGRQVNGQVRIIDIFPTITGFVGAETPSVVQGVDLRPFLSDSQDHPVLTAYSEALYPRYNYGLSHLLALHSDGWKYIHAPRPELYFLEDDPREERNLAQSDPQRLESMRTQLRDLLAAAPTVVEPDEVYVQTTQRAVEALRSLGYVGQMTDEPSMHTGDPLDLMDLEGGDPKDFAEVIQLTTNAARLIQARDFRAAERDLRQLLATEVEEWPNFSWAYGNLGLMLATRKAWDEAIVFYRKSLDISPNDSQTLTNLGVALGNTGQIEEALAMYHRALQMQPVYRETHINLAATYRYIGRIDEANEHDRLAQEAEPRLPGSRFH